MRNVLIDEWFPINEVSVESIRERSASSALPPLYFLHVWFARRPLITARATIVTSLVENLDRKQILSILGIPHDENLLEAQSSFMEAKASGRKLSIKPFSWKRAYRHIPSLDELEWFRSELQSLWDGKIPVLLDPMAGGGSIPYEALRLGLPVFAGDLNPVAYIVLKGTLEYPVKFKYDLIPAVEKFCKTVHEKARKELIEYFPKSQEEKIFAYLWARTVRCNSCNLLIPLSPTWWIVRNGDSSDLAIKLVVPKQDKDDICSFEIIEDPKTKGYEPDEGTDIGKEARCPRCLAKTDGETVKKMAKSGEMGHQLYLVCTKRHSGGRKLFWRFRAPSQTDLEAVDRVTGTLAKKMHRWEQMGIVPATPIGNGLKMGEPLNFGINRWIDFFNNRQLLAHLTYLEKYLEEKDRILSDQNIDKHLAEAILVYGAMVFDTSVDYNCLLSLWDSTRLKVAHMMGLQAFPFKSSYAEFDHSDMLWPWSTAKALDSVKELIKLLPSTVVTPTIFNSDFASLPLDDNSIDAIIVDPPYHDNVMYGEISDFFYVWLKKLVGDLFPRVFRGDLTNKTDEAVVNTSLYRDTKSAKEMANLHYGSKMLSGFKDMRRVLREDGVLTVMFTHRKVEAWAELTKALSQAGFTFRSSWPVFTEPSAKFGKANKGVLKVTILLSCRKREKEKRGLWSEVQRELLQEAEKHVKLYAENGLTGMNLLVSTYGPVLGRYTDYTSIKDSYGTSIGPEKALDVVSEVVNRFNTQELTSVDLDTLAYINLLKNFPQLTVDEDLARVTTVFGGQKNIQELGTKSGRGMLEKKAGKVTILLAKDRLANGHLDIDNPENLKDIIDIVHASLIMYENRGVGAVKDLLMKTGKDITDSSFLSVLKVVCNIGYNGNIASKKLIEEREIARLLMEALGHEPESFTKKHERIEHYF